MKLLEIAGDKFLEGLTGAQNATIIDDELLAIKLRGQVFLPDSEQIKKNPLCLATSAELAKKGKKVFWLMTGGLMESSLNFSHETTIGEAPVALGFEANALLDYHSLQPYTVELPKTIETIAKNLTVDLPLDVECAGNLLPGSSFQLVGKANAKLSAGLNYTKGIASVAVSASGDISGEFALRIIRGEKDMVTVSISQILSRSLNINGKASVGWSIGTGDILEHKLFKKGKAALDTLDLDTITGSIPGWDGDQKLSDYLIGKGEEPVGKFLKNYSSFYLSLGRETSHTNRSLVKYIIDLSTQGGKDAYTALCHFDEDKTAQLSKVDENGIERIEFKEYKTVDKTSAELGFPGKKLLLSHTLRSMREGYLIYDNHLQVMELELHGKKTVFFNNNQELTWEGFDVQVDDQNTGRDYWRFFFKRQDAFTSKDEILRFSRFATLLNVEPIDESKVKSYPWYTKLLKKDDNTDFLVDLYFTESGIMKLNHVSKHDVRKAVFQCAEGMEFIESGVMFEDNTVRKLLLDYLQLGLDYDDDEDREKIIEEYCEINNRKRNQIKNDAKTMAKARILVEHVLMLQDKDPADWNGVFLKLGTAVNADFMVIIAAICNLVGHDDTFLSSLEIKRQKGGRVIVSAKEKGAITTGDEIFNKAQQVVVDAKA